MEESAMRATRRQIVVGGSAAAATLALGGPSLARAQDKTKISWWHIQTKDPALGEWKAVADAYMAANPNVEIEITVLDNEPFKAKMTTVMQSGSPPDIFHTWGGGVLYEYANAGLVRDITEDLAKDGWGDSFLPAALNLYGTDGKNYGAPWDVGVVVLWYNKALFNQVGIEEPPTTWEDLLATVEKFKEARITPITVGEKEKWPGHFWWVYLAIRNGGKSAFDAAYSREGSFADPPFVKAGTDLKQLIDAQPFQEGFLGAGYNQAEALLANGEVAMELMGHWSLANQKTLAENKKGLGDDLGFFMFPAVTGGAGGPTDVLGGGGGWALGKDAPDEAVDFLRFLLNVDHQKSEAGQGILIPVVKGAESGLTEPLLQEIAKKVGEAEYLQLYYDQFLPPAVGATVNDAVQTLFAGTGSPEDVANAIEQSAADEMDG
jgi:raffinose/stachyose/melibiose transport system substrate-binding protein